MHSEIQEQTDYVRTVSHSRNFGLVFIDYEEGELGVLGEGYELDTRKDVCYVTLWAE